MPLRHRLLVLLSFCLAGLGARLEAVTAYPYGTLPSAAADADLTTAYNLWKSRRYVAASCGYRVDNGGGNTYSEGMGYGMLMAAYIESNDTMLANLYTFYAANLDGNGLMNWSVSASSCSNNSANAATDGDLDAALALVRAAKRWPASSNNWSAKATTLLNNIYLHEVDSCKGLKNGDTWGGCGDAGNKAYNPSYFRTGYLRSFDCFEGGSRWAAVATQSYSVLAKTISSYKLPPDWVYNNGNVGAFDAAGGYGYDSCRTPWAVGMDYLWWGNTTAQTLDNNVTASFAAQGSAAAIGDDYNYSTGAKDSSNHEPEFFGAVGVASMVGSNSSFRDALYTELKNVDKNTYFADSLRVIYLMVMTGNFPEPCNGGGPAGSPTRTPSFTASPSRTPSFTPSPTPTPAFSLVKSASASTAAVGTAFTYYLDYANLSSGPDTTGVTPGMSLQFHNANTGTGVTRAGTDFEIVNGTGAAVNLSNYRIRYFLYDAVKTATTDYAAYSYSDGTSVATAGLFSYPAYTGGPRNANMEMRLTFGSYSLGNGANVQWQGAVGSNSDSWNLTTTDDWSYPGSVGSFSAANAADIVLEQNVAGTWKLAFGAYPGGSAAIANVTLSDVLDSRVDYVSSVPAGTWSAGTHTFSYSIPSLAAGASGRLTITAQFNGTAAVGNVVPNSATIGASGYGSVSSNTQNVTVAGAANTPTFTATRTATPSATRTATPSASPTATPSQTPPASTATGTPSATPSVTRTGTRTATASATASHTPLASTATGTPTATPSGTRSATQTNTPLASTATGTPSATATRTGTTSATRTATPSSTALPPTATATPTATSSRTATQSATASATATATRSRTVTPTASETFTNVPAGSSATATPSISPTSTVTPTASPSGTPSASPSGTGTPSATLTQSPVPTSTFSPVPTDTFTTAPTNTFSPVPTNTFTPVVTNTFTTVPTNTFTPVVTNTFTTVPTNTFTPVVTNTFTTVPTNTFTPVLTNTFTAVPTNTFTPVPPTPTSVPGGSGGPLIIDEHRPWPNPIHGGPAYLSLHLSGACDRVSVKLYTRAWICVGEASGPGTAGAGWTRIDLPAGFVDGAPSGAYYYVADAQRGGTKAEKAAKGSVQVLR